MKYAFLTLLLVISAAALQAQGWRPGEMEIKLFAEKPGDIARIQRLKLATEPISRYGTLWRACVTPTELDSIRNQGLNYQVTIADLNATYHHYWDNPMVPTGYYSYEQIIAIADSLAANFPAICKKVMWGTSVGGRQLAALKISDNVDTDEAQPEVLLDGGIHGDEVGGSQYMIMYARDLCKGYGINPVYTDLINSREIWIYLMVNPDGRVNMSRYNGNFVDCNRDNGYMWNGEGNSTGAFSQPESKALRDCIFDNHFVVYTNYHSGSELLAYPWSYRADMTRDHNHINQLAGIYAATSGYTNLLYGQGYTIMYPINGSTKDVVYGSLGSIGWSMELSVDKQPPANLIQTYYAYNTPAMTEMIRRAGWGVEGTVVDSLTGKPVRATIWVGNYFPVYNDPLVGDYQKYVLPGTYAIRVEANGYKPKTVTGALVPPTGSAIKDIQLVPDQKWAGYRVISCQIPGNNFGDEGYTPGALGSADSIAYAMGKGGWIVIDMGDTIFDGPGADFRIIQHGSPAKPFQVSGSNSMDGPFTAIGSGVGTSAFDFASGPLHKCRYLLITDTETGPSLGPGVGFNLDAVEMLTPPLIVNISASNTVSCQGSGIDFTDSSVGNPTSWNWSFPGGVPATSNAQNPFHIVYTQPGTYNVSLTISNGISSTVKVFSNFITVIPYPEVKLGNDTSICDWAKLTLDAGNPGASFLWSTGQTTQTITVDSTGTGHGTHAYSVIVTSAPFCQATDTIRVSYDNCTGINQNQEQPTIIIYPNPVKGNLLNFQVRNMSGAVYQVLSPLGTILASGIITGALCHNNIPFTISAKGAYLLRVQKGGETSTLLFFVR